MTAFLSVLWVAGFLAWITDRKWPWTDGPMALAAAVIAGLGAGIVLGAWAA